LKRKVDKNYVTTSDTIDCIDETSNYHIEADVSKNHSDDSQEMSCQSNAPLYEMESSDHDLMMSPLGQLLLLFRKPFTSGIGHTTGHVIDHVGNKVGNTVNRLGISSALPIGTIKNFTDLIYTGNDVAALEVELAKNSKDLALLDGVAQDLEDISPEERDYLVDQAFTHEALRAKKPIIWIPQDDLGIAADEIDSIEEKYPNILISSDGATLNSRGKVIFVGRPPDYDSKSKIAL